MKKATATLDKKAFIELLKIPHTVNLVGIKYPVEDDRVELTFTGDGLPVKKAGKIKYTIMRHWHLAKMELLEEENKDGKRSKGVSTRQTKSRET